MITKEQVAGRQYKKGTKYAVDYFGRTKGRKKSFEGKVIQETDCLLVLEDKRGIIESFLKVDFLNRYYKIKEVH